MTTGANAAEGAVLTTKCPVILIELLLDKGAVRIWTRPFTGTFEGETYRPLGGLTGSLAIKQSLDRPSLDANAQLEGDSAELRAIAVQEEFQLRPSTIQLGEIDPSGVVVDATTLFAGRLRNMPIVDDVGNPSVTAILGKLGVSPERLGEAA